MSKHHVIYIAGLGDRRSFGQDKAIMLWNLFGLKPHYMALGWENPDGFENKMARLDDKVQSLCSQGYKVSLVGVSAGAGAAVNYYATHPEIHKVVLVSGKVNNPQAVHPQRYKVNPDFQTSMEQTGKSLEIIKSKNNTKNILSIYSKNDGLVPPKDSIIEGASHEEITAKGHPLAILSTILFHINKIARFIKS